MLSKKRMWGFIVILPGVAIAAHMYVTNAPGYSPAQNAQSVLANIRSGLVVQEQSIKNNDQTIIQLNAAMNRLNLQISSMQKNYQNHLLSLAQQGLISLNN